MNSETGTFSTRRRWHRPCFRSARTIVLLTTIGISCFLVQKQEVDRQREAVQAIREWGGWVLLDNECDDEGFPRTRRPATPRSDVDDVFGAGLPIVTSEAAGPGWLRRMLGDDFFSTAKSARIENDEGMERLAALSHLEYLFLSGSQVTAAGLKYLEGLPDLRCLDLQCTGVTDESLKHIRASQHLEELQLAGTRVSDAGLPNLAELSNLERLSLSGTLITDAGLLHLKALTRLRLLNVESTHVTEVGLKELQKALPYCEIRGSPASP